MKMYKHVITQLEQEELSRLIEDSYGIDGNSQVRFNHENEKIDVEKIILNSKETLYIAHKMSVYDSVREKNIITIHPGEFVEVSTMVPKVRRMEGIYIFVRMKPVLDSENELEPIYATQEIDDSLKSNSIVKMRQESKADVRCGLRNLKTKLIMKYRFSYDNYEIRDMFIGSVPCFTKKELKDGFILDNQVFEQINNWLEQRESNTNRLIDVHNSIHDRDLFMLQTNGSKELFDLRFRDFLCKKVRTKEVILCDTREYCQQSLKLCNSDLTFYTGRFLLKRQWVKYCPNLQFLKQTEDENVFKICKIQYQNLGYIQEIVGKDQVSSKIFGNELWRIFNRLSSHENSAIKESKEPLSGNTACSNTDTRISKSFALKQTKKRRKDGGLRKLPSSMLTLNLQVSKLALLNHLIKTNKISPYCSVLFGIKGMKKKRDFKRERKVKQEKILNTPFKGAVFTIEKVSKIQRIPILVPTKEDVQETKEADIEKRKPFTKRLEIAACRMDSTRVPKEIPCRNDEKERIKNFITTSLQNGGSQTSLYISGMPGTGKTVSTVNTIKELAKDKSLPNFMFVEINGMSLCKPQEIYTIMCRKILGKSCRPSTSALLLENFFCNKKKYKKRPFTLLLIDELDALITRKQDLLYNLFNWPAYGESKLIIVSIANTMNLPEMFLTKIQSRIGENRLVYQPYKAAQIKTILQSRLGDTDVINEDALLLISNKISSLSGDFRRALLVCKRAIEICKYDHLGSKKSCVGNHQEKVQFEHIMRAFDELFNSKTDEILRSLRKCEKWAIESVISEMDKSHLDRISLNKAKERLRDKATHQTGDKSYLKDTEASEIYLRLQNLGIIIISEEKRNLKDSHWVELRLFIDEVKNALECSE
ncbi:unnamed protein product [Moneuplotes crassus]|uniref:Origin recognition complex subunit 1 n=1 Tax=Euplotes crassus TaxID=5936 RepID=A0AAD1Y595_EUPCR|nr:unnamed protein product [Moneuplotes crassus]